MDFGIIGVAAITVICYLAAELVKATKLGGKSKWLPVICGAVGVVLGIVGLFIMPDFPADNVITAAAVGAVSGFAATGVDQVKKQLVVTNGGDGDADE